MLENGKFLAEICEMAQNTVTFRLICNLTVTSYFVFSSLFLLYIILLGYSSYRVTVIKDKWNGMR